MPLSPRTAALMDSKTSTGRRQKTIRIAAIGIGLLIVAAAGVGIGVGLNRNRVRAGNSVSDTSVDSRGSEAALLASEAATPRTPATVTPTAGTPTTGTPTTGTPTTGTPATGTPTTGTPTTGTNTPVTPTTGTPTTGTNGTGTPTTGTPTTGTNTTGTPTTGTNATVTPPTEKTESEALQEYYSFGTECPPDGIAWPQWTGRALSVIGVPTPIQSLYAEVQDGSYNPATKKYTLGFNGLPEDLTYCSQGSKKLEKECREVKAATNTLLECGTEEGTQMWTHNNGKKKCETFTYNGCGGNGNQFASQSLCQVACETPIKATMGGTVTFSKEDGVCSLPPTKPDGSSCCTMKLWQPNYAGFYYDNCSVEMDLGGDGLYFFKTEIPGSELSSQWGPDPEPHIHYDILCKDCAANDYFTGEFRYWNKFYPEDICKLESCYNKKPILIAGPEHKAQKKEVVDGELRYTYSMSLPSQDADFDLIG